MAGIHRIAAAYHRAWRVHKGVVRLRGMVEQHLHRIAARIEAVPRGIQHSASKQRATPSSHEIDGGESDQARVVRRWKKASACAVNMNADGAVHTSSDKAICAWESLCARSHVQAVVQLVRGATPPRWAKDAPDWTTRIRLSCATWRKESFA